MKPSYEELEARCAALAAENAGMNKFIDDECYVYGPHDVEPVDAALEKPETPATDAFLAEVRASAKADGVQEYADSFRHAASKHRELYGESIRVKALIHEAGKADEFAAQLRQEAK